MKLRPLIIDDRFKARVAEIVDFARAHHYIPGETLIPGDDPHYVLKTEFGYRCVFSLTQVPDGLFRDLTVSVAEKKKWPNPVAVFTLAQAFGFSGWDGKTIEPPPPEWAFAKDPYWNAIRVVQKLP